VILVIELLVNRGEKEFMFYLSQTIKLTTAELFEEAFREIPKYLAIHWILFLCVLVNTVLIFIYIKKKSKALISILLIENVFITLALFFLNYMVVIFGDISIRINEKFSSLMNTFLILMFTAGILCVISIFKCSFEFIKNRTRV
jgi:hypothetical protein